MITYLDKLNRINDFITKEYDKIYEYNKEICKYKYEACVREIVGNIYNEIMKII